MSGDNIKLTSNSAHPEIVVASGKKGLGKGWKFHFSNWSFIF